MLTKLKESIESFSANKSYSNDASRYLPIGPNMMREQGLNWSFVRKSIYEKLLGLKCEFTSSSQLFEKIIDDISSKRETKELENLVQSVYLHESTLSSFSPYLNLICDDKPKARTKTMVSVFGSMLADFKPLDIVFAGTNFVEGIINTSIKKQCITSSTPINASVYLPFLARLLKKDFQTLSSKTAWLYDEFDHFVELYSFLYLTQLSLHLGIVNERFNEPKSQELFFILETEKASKERHECNIKGYDKILSNHNGFGLDIFSHLGYLELLSDLPIWMLSERHVDNHHTQDINTLNQLICNQFGITFSGNKSSVEEAINDGLYYHRQLFKKSSRTSSRSDANDKVFTTFKNGFAVNFKSNRKAAGGWYFQLSTKSILLISNLIIGTRQKLLIDDVIEGFRERGIYFDLKSRNALLKVYENIGNIEKLSDSGDAVYVKSTI
ncbi:DNA phosphorothioation-dependent restriction protein DptG [Aliikangiella sp. IMCC44359]|uniref:DNA phosphorothioation-dependent restriction protein DptG n=1 Tax=Aliikangiella sp. IMCC44359 TaxID=3459125 RepID=UPI00403AC4AA